MGFEFTIVSDIDSPFEPKRLVHIHIIVSKKNHYVRTFVCEHCNSPIGEVDTFCNPCGHSSVDIDERPISKSSYEINLMDYLSWSFFGGLIEVNIQTSLSPLTRVK